MEKHKLPRFDGTLRAHSIKIPETVWKAKGIVIFGTRIKSIVFSTDIALIRNCNADAVMAVYPFTPQQVISQAIINSTSKPVFAGVGGGTTTGVRSIVMAKDAEAHGAYGVVVNGPMKNDTISVINKLIDIPIISTVLSTKTDIGSRIEAGVSILNVSAGPKTPEVVSCIREKYPDVPIIATGGPTSESILKTVETGANAISYTPPSSSEVFEGMMKVYREKAEVEDESKGDTLSDRELLRMLSKLE